MATPQSTWRKVAALDQVPAGESIGVKLEEGISVALFNIDGRIYATDNQCPHMGYPLSRGTVRHGILTCDWHGRSFDLEAGGCFHSECDDLATFAAEVRGDEIWIEVGDLTYKRRDEHLRLLWEGLLSGDRWTMSKAIALLLNGGVREEEVVQLVLRHVGRHIATSHGPEGGEDVARLINGLKIGQRYSGEDRLIALTTAVGAAAGGAAERLEVIELPGEVPWEKISAWVAMFGRDGQSGRIERCLFTAYRQGDQDRILPLLFRCSVEPYFLGFADNLISLGYLSEVVEVFGWDKASELVCNLGGKLVGRGRNEPERFRRDAVQLMRELQGRIDAASARDAAEYDEDALVAALSSADIERSFTALIDALEAGVAPQRMIATLILLAADRMARLPVTVNAGWPELTTELNMAAALRAGLAQGGDAVAARGLFHAAWQIFADRWLNIPARRLTAPLDPAPAPAAAEQGLQQVVAAIESLDVHAAGERALGYLQAGHDADALLQAMGRTILWDDTGAHLLSTLRTVFEEWEGAADHPARFQLPVGLARYATAVRTNKDSGSAATTAMRFAEGKTTVEIFEE